jgi:protein scribble
MGNDLGKELMKKKYKKKEVVGLRKQGIPEIPKSVRQLQCRELILAENDITSLPDELGKLARIEVLDLGNNRINHVPPALGDLAPTLRELWLCNNKLFFTAPLTPNLGKLRLLQKLDPSGNQLEEPPAELGQLSALQYLDISGNSLQVFPPEFGNLRALLIFKAENNRLRALAPEVGNLTELSEWYLANNALSRLPPQIGNLRNLQVCAFPLSPLSL